MRYPFPLEITFPIVVHVRCLKTSPVRERIAKRKLDDGILLVIVDKWAVDAEKADYLMGAFEPRLGLVGLYGCRRRRCTGMQQWGSFLPYDYDSYRIARPTKDTHEHEITTVS